MSKINLKESKCPVCGAPLKLKDEGYGETTCSYCGAIIYAEREDTSPKGEITLYDETNTKPIATLTLPIGWDVSNAYTSYDKSSLRIPYAVGAELINNKGSMICIETGNSYEMFGGAGMSGVGQAPHTYQKNFIEVDKYLDEFMEAYGKSCKINIKFKEALDIPVKGYDKEKDFKAYQEVANVEAKKQQASIGTMPTIKGLYCDSACRAYEGDDKKVYVAYTKEYGYLMSAFGGLGNIGDLAGNLMQGVSGLFGNVSKNMNKNPNGNILNKMADSGLLGGMLGKKFKSQNQEPVKEEIKEEPKVEKKEEVQENPVYFGQIKNPGLGEAYMWMTDPVFLLITSKDEYKELVKKAFTQVCSTFTISREVVGEHNQMRMQWENEQSSNMRAQAQAQYQHGEQLIQMGAQRMANNYAYIDSMRERSNKQFESQRSAYNNRMAAQDRMSEARSEAIRGVNTYIKPDGKEVEVSVSADTAWINGKGEIVGGSSGFDPGYGWTKMERK